MTPILGSYALGSHCYFFREGDAITVPAPGSAAGAATSSNQPAASDPLYMNLGPILSWEDDFKAGKVEEVWGPSPGKLQLLDEIDLKVMQKCKFDVEQVSAIALEIFYRTSTKLTAASVQFNPNNAPTRRGWLHIERYDQSNNFFFACDLWGRIRVTGGVLGKDGGLTKPSFEMTVYYSSLNTAILNNQ